MAKRYEVIGTRRVHGHIRGERFWADIPPAIEDVLLGVHLALVVDEEPRQRPRARLIHPTNQAGDASVKEDT